MSPRQIERFFRALARELDQPATIILTGAAAGSLWGHVRPSLDIDFAIRPVRRGGASWTRIEEAVSRATQRTGVAVNYAEDIDRWGPISLMDDRRHTTLYRRFEALEVRILDPAYWSIGKISRYLDPDVQDLVGVLSREQVPAKRLVALWAKALRSSPRSTACTLFRRQTEHFLRTYGKTVWGKTFDVEAALRQFSRGMAPNRHRHRTS